MPVSKVSAKGFVKNAVDAQHLARLLRTVVYDLVADPNIVHAYVERVSAFPGQGVASMFSLGHSLGIVQGALAALAIPYTMVEPKDWKARYRLSSDKSLSLTIARRLYPMVELNLGKHHGRAEALLIARHGQLTSEGK